MFACVKGAGLDDRNWLTPSLHLGSDSGSMTKSDGGVARVNVQQSRGNRVSVETLFSGGSGVENDCFRLVR